MGETDEPEFSYDNEPAQWSQVSQTEISCQTEMIDPILQVDDTQTACSPTVNFHSGQDDTQGSPENLKASTALRELNNGDKCLKTEPKAQLNHVSGENVILPRVNSLGSLVGSLDATDPHVKGKAPKLKRAPKIDPCLREAITAVFSKASIGNDAGSDQNSKPALDTVMSNTVHAYGISPKKMDTEISISSPVNLPGGNLDNAAPCSGASSTVAHKSEDLVDQEQKIQEFLKAIQAAGYTLKRDTKSTGLGHTVDQLGSAPSKKRDQESCPRCKKFRGRPCEVKYAPTLSSERSELKIN